MLGNVALDVAIGLMFIFLLYSLLATVISEIIATFIGLRARNLREAIDRMLNDEQDSEKSLLARLLDSLSLLKNPDNEVVKAFYDNPEIKYLGSSGIFRAPSSFKAVSFSKTLLQMLFGSKELTPEKITYTLELLAGERAEDPSQKPDPNLVKLSKETAGYVLSLWRESYGDIIKFRYHLETWFDRTMDQAIEWYKRKLRIVLIFLGFMLAWLFNADTFQIIDILSTDKDAREKMVEMASAYIKENKVVVASMAQKVDSATLQTYNQRLDSLLQIKKDLESDIARSHSILGLGSWPGDTLHVYFDPKTRKPIFSPAVDEMALPDSFLKKPLATEYIKAPSRMDSQVKVSGTDTIASTAAAIAAPTQVARSQTYIFDRCSKIKYFLNLFAIHFFGYLVTALAISLGAPFWFDTLNKVMKLRTSVKVPTTSPNISSGNDTVLITDREA